jgi:hypothetical protein
MKRLRQQPKTSANVIGRSLCVMESQINKWEGCFVMLSPSITSLGALSDTWRDVLTPPIPHVSNMTELAGNLQQDKSIPLIWQNIYAPKSIPLPHMFVH